MTNHAETFGERLRAYRAAAGLSQEELAERSGVSVRAIGDMERGRTRWPHRDSVRCLTDVLGLMGQEREGFLALARRPVANAAEPEPVATEWTLESRGPSYLYSGSRLDADADADMRQVPLYQGGGDFPHASDGARHLRVPTRRQLTAILVALVAVLSVLIAIAGLKTHRAPAPAPTAPTAPVGEQIDALNQQLGNSTLARRMVIMQRLMAIANSHPDTESVSNRVLADLISFAVYRSEQPRLGGQPPPDLLYALQAIGGGYGDAFVDTPNMTKLMSNADLADLDLAGLQFNTALLDGADLRGADLRDAGLNSVVLAHARLQGADLTDTDLTGADLSAAQLQGADLRGAKLTGADFSGANLTGAKLLCSSLPQAKDVPAVAVAHCAR